MKFHHSRIGRPSTRANLDDASVALSFRVDPALKNLLLDISEGSGVSMTEMLSLMVLKESGFTDLQSYRDADRDTIEVVV